MSGVRWRKDSHIPAPLTSFPVCKIKQSAIYAFASFLVYEHCVFRLTGSGRLCDICREEFKGEFEDASSIYGTSAAWNGI